MWHYNFTKYCACHEKSLSWLILFTHETLFTMRGATGVIVQPHQILRLPRKMTVRNVTEIWWKQLKRHLQCATDPRLLRAWSEHETVSPQPASQPRLLFKYCPGHEKWQFNFTKYCACHEKWDLNFTKYIEKYNILRSGYHSKFHEILPLPRRKVTLIIDPCHIWNAVYNARSNRCYCPTSPNTAPATKSHPHHGSLSHLKRYIQRAARSNRCHDPTSPNTAPATKNDRPKCDTNVTKTAETSFTMRDRSETVPTMIRACMIRAWNRHSEPASQPRLLFPLITNILHWKIQHFALRLSFQISRNTAPATKSDTSKYCTCHEKWHLDFTKYCACNEKWHLDFTRYCACHEKWLFYYLTLLPVVPHKAVAEVSRIGNYRRDWLLWVTDGRAKTLMDRTVQLCNWLTD